MPAISKRKKKILFDKKRPRREVSDPYCRLCSSWLESSLLLQYYILKRQEKRWCTAPPCRFVRLIVPFVVFRLAVPCGWLPTRQPQRQRRRRGVPPFRLFLLPILLPVIICTRPCRMHKAAFCILKRMKRRPWQPFVCIPFCARYANAPFCPLVCVCVSSFVWLTEITFYCSCMYVCIMYVCMYVCV